MKRKQSIRRGIALALAVLMAAAFAACKNADKTDGPTGIPTTTEGFSFELPSDTLPPETETEEPSTEEDTTEPEETGDWTQPYVSPTSRGTTTTRRSTTTTRRSTTTTKPPTRVTNPATTTKATTATTKKPTTTDPYTTIKDSTDKMTTTKPTTGATTTKPTTGTGTATGTQTTTQVGGTVHATAISVSPKALTLTVGETAQLTATLTPSNATTAYYFDSIDKTVATVSGTGRVTALKGGTTTVKVFCATPGGVLEASCTVTVEAIKATKINISAKTGVTVESDGTVVMKVNSTAQLAASVEPAKAEQGVTWAITNGQEYASINQNGVVTSYAYPDRTITITATSKEPGSTVSRTTTITIR